MGTGQLKQDKSEDGIESGNQSSDFTPKTFESTLELIGGFGLFQWFIFVVLFLPEIPAASILFIPVFIGKEPSHWECEEGGLILNVSSICSCKGTISSNESSIVGEWGLVCEKSWVSDGINSVQMLGMLVGGASTAQLSDWCGRKVTYLLVCGLMILGNFVSALSQSAFLYAAARFVAGASLSGFMCIVTVYPMEFVTPRWRFLCGSVGPWGEGIMLMAVLAYFVQDWRHLLLYSTIPFITTVAIFLIPESPKWLLRNGKLTKASGAMVGISKMNGLKNFHLTDEELRLMAEVETQGSTRSKFSYLSFFLLPDLRKKSIVLISIWFAYSAVYFGLNYNVKNMSGSPYVNMFLMGLADAIGYPLSLLLNNRIGRRKSLILFMGWAAAFLVLLTALDLSYGVSLGNLTVAVICLVGKLGVAGARSSSRLLTAEAFPTPIRTMAFGMTGVGAGIAGMIAPQIVYLGSKWWRGLPFLFFAVISVVGSGLSLMLPETAGQVLQEKIGQSTPGEVKVELIASLQAVKLPVTEAYSMVTICLDSP